MEDYNDVFKIIVVGDSEVGKTNIISTFTMRKTLERTMPTVGIEYTSKLIQIQNGKRFKAQIWDTAGQQRYRSISLGNFKKAVGALIVYDITNRTSFQNCTEWVNMVRERADEDVQIMLVGNKTDLPRRQVEVQQGRKLSSQLGVSHLETTIRDYSSIERVFHQLVEQIYKKRPFGSLGLSIKLHDAKDIDNSSDSCKC